MRKYLLAVMLLLGLGALPTAAQAQFCPGPGFVFIDVADTDPFCPVITWIADRGITLGCNVIDGGHRMFCPNDSVSRSQTAAFLNRLADFVLPLSCANGSVTNRAESKLSARWLPSSVSNRSESSSMIVPTAVLSASVTFVGELRPTWNVSFGSTNVSPMTRTVTVLLVSPGVKVTVRLKTG